MCTCFSLKGRITCRSLLGNKTPTPSLTADEWRKKEINKELMQAKQAGNCDLQTTPTPRNRYGGSVASGRTESVTAPA